MCEHHQPLNIFDFSSLGPYGLVISLFIMGLSGGFIHCIGMCGPFALSISHMRLMLLPSTKMSQTQKLNALFATPYYLGKALTYTLLTAIFYTVANLLKNIPIANYLAFVFLMIMAMIFIIMGINSSVHITSKTLKRAMFFKLFLDKHFKHITNQFGFNGLLTGLILGLIPCGLVVAAITQANSLAPNIWLAMISVFAFGIATVPGLFLVSLLGGIVLNNISKQIFKIIYAIVMVYNAYALMVYALKLV